MMTGNVTPRREIVVDVDAIAEDGDLISFEAVIDTGFDGSLTLPLALLTRLDSAPAGTRRAELGDGRVVEFDIYVAKVSWHDAECKVLVLQSEAAPLVGMSLLWGSRVTFDAQDDGAITIDVIP